MVQDPRTQSTPRLVVDLDALRHNFQAVRLAAGVPAGAAVKANAYGTGLDAVVPALAQAGCRTFFTAFAAEGAAVRRLDPDARIFVLSPVIALDAEVLITHRLVPCLYDFDGVDRWLASAGGVGTTPAAALHFETGINRLGFDDEAATLLAQAEGPYARLQVELIMSHLACADDPSSSVNTRQLERFRAIKARFPGVRASLANSGGSFLGPEYAFDLVRPGICLYGHDPHYAHGHRRVQPVARLQAVLAQVKQVRAGEGIGYGSYHICHTDTRIAVVLAGYADGVHRHLSASAQCPSVAFDIDGHSAPVLGRISMDMCTVDLGAVPAAAAYPGATVEIFGNAVALETIAERAGTIPYELLTSVGPRVQRVYLGQRS